MYQYNKILAVMAVLALVVSLFAVSVSAEGVDGLEVNDSSVVASTEEEIVEPDGSEFSDSELTNVYLRYITGILAIFLVIVLFYFTYKFFAMFF